MKVAAPSFEPGTLETRALTRAIRWSFAVHVVLVLALFLVPREWLAKPQRTPPMTIVLGGTPGPRSTGTTSLGGRTVEEQAPPPPRPAPVRPTPPAPPAPAATPPRTPPSAVRPAERPRPTPAPTRPPTRGPEVTQGNTRVDTGVRGQGAGLTFGGGGGGGGQMEIMNFCCPAYLQLLRDRVDERWSRNQPERGVVVVRFTVRRDGSIENVQVTQPSDYGVLNRASRAAVEGLRLPPLPAEYGFETLTVNLQFPYGGS